MQALLGPETFPVSKNTVGDLLVSVSLATGTMSSAWWVPIKG